MASRPAAIHTTHSDHRLAGRSQQRRLGAFYTGDNAAEYMALWAASEPNAVVLEPSFGGCSFVRALFRVSQTHGLQLYGAELVPDVAADAIAAGLLKESNVHVGDFMDMQPFPVDAVIGNPPYVRLRHLPAKQQSAAENAARLRLGYEMESSGSLWMPFVLHSLKFLKHGGRLAFVLPFELTYVRYAKPLWKHLGECFDFLRVVRVKERLFPEILQDVVLLFADGFGGSTLHVAYDYYDTFEQLKRSEHDDGQLLPLASVVAGEKSFIQAHLSVDLLELLKTKVYPETVPLREFCTFNIGYVAGDKDFFHPDSEVSREYGIRTSSLKPTLTSSRQLSGRGLYTSAITDGYKFLFHPPIQEHRLSLNERAYIASGKEAGIHTRYKCRVRDPWYVVPGVWAPDVLLSVFVDTPSLLINDQEFVASNSLLCGFLKRNKTSRGLAAAWYTSLTLLMAELEVHALGGGVMIFIPGEVSKIRLFKHRLNLAHLKGVDLLLQKGKTDLAYYYGDDAVLRKGLKLKSKDINLIHEGLNVLRSWRRSVSQSAKIDN